MKKSLLVFLILLAMMGIANAQKLALRISGGPFIPIDQNFKQIYGNSFQLGGEVNWQLTNLVTARFGVWYLASAGQMTYTGAETQLDIWSLDMGVRLHAPLSWVRPYVGASLGPSHIKEQNEIGVVSDTGIAFMGEAGLLFPIRTFSVELGGRYSYCAVNPVEESVNIGGFFVYAGFGYRF